MERYSKSINSNVIEYLQPRNNFETPCSFSYSKLKGLKS